MVSLGIIWNSVQNYKEEILDDISKKVVLKESFDMDLSEEYVKFVTDIYSSENMEKWKIDKKINNMILDNNKKITVVLFEFDEGKIFYHEFKHKNVYEQLELLKKDIREKYKDYIDNYVFDIVFHATDDLDELKKCFDIIKNYQQYIVSEQLEKYKKLVLHSEGYNEG